MVLTFLCLPHLLNIMVLTRDKRVYYIARPWVFILALQEKKEEGEEENEEEEEEAKNERRRTYPILIVANEKDKTKVFL